MRAHLPILIAFAFFVGCAEESAPHSTAESTSQEGNNLMDWIRLFDGQKERFGGTLPNPEEFKRSGHVVYFIQVERTEDTRTRLFALKPDYASRFRIYSEMAAFISALNRLEGNAVICHTTEDVAGSPAFTYSEIEKIRNQFQSGERLVVVYPGG